MATAPQGPNTPQVTPLIVLLWLVPSAVLLYGGYRSLKKSRSVTQHRPIVRQPVSKPEPSISHQAETQVDENVRVQATTFATALKEIIEYGNITINLPMPEETLKKYGWQTLQSASHYTIDDEPLVANLSKLVNLGPPIIPLLKDSIISVSTKARSASQFRNAGLLCQVIGKIGGREGCDALRSLFTKYSNVYEYQYIRGQAALGLALAGDKDAAKLLIEMRTNSPRGMEAQYGGIAGNIDEALTMLGVEPPETWDRVATQFISEIRSGTPNFKDFSEKLSKFKNEEIGGAWNAVATDYWKRRDKVMAQRCWLEGLHKYPSPDFVAAWSHLELPQGAPKNLETVERLRKQLGALTE
jgi:hypothetical protein